MGLFDKLFRSTERREADAVFEKVYRLMADESAQNAIYPSELQQLLAAGGGIDQQSGASGDFGRDVANPVPVNGPLGELIYLSNLLLPNGAQMIGHRLGSMARQDVYEVVSLDGSKWDLLFFDPYHSRKSRRLPSGYKSGTSPERFLLATNYYVNSFPLGMGAAMRKCTERIIGVPLVAPQLRDESGLLALSRPPSHVGLLHGLRLEGQMSAG